MIFYKGVLQSDLKTSDYIPGTVTKVFKEALMWCERIQSSKDKGAARHVRHGKAVIIEIDFDETSLLDCSEFQRPGVNEHTRKNCWLSASKTKAQINTPVKYKVLTDIQINHLFSL